MEGKPLSLLLPPSHSTRAPELLQACAQVQARPRPTQELEMPWQRMDGSLVSVAVTCSPVVDRDGAIIAGSLIARDNSERVRADEHVKLMLGELNHRVKNTLASVQAIAMQTITHSASLEEFRGAFVERLLALSSTHNLLADDAWNGVGLREIVYAELAPYEREGDTRVALNGEALLLTPKAALALSMALHELATNAGKYGALSVPQGRVDVHWKMREVGGRPWLRLLWTESGGPTVAPPTRHGFGTRLIREGLAFELDGTVVLEFKPGGVVCRVDVPLAELAVSP
jgi:two-component system CheB/CheR fusion protein